MQQEYFGPNSTQKIKDILQQESPSSILLIRGKESYITSSAKEKLTPLLASYKVTEFKEYSNNPLWEEIKEGINIWKQINPTLVIAVGGGSALDVAKAITILAEQEDEPELYLQKKKPLLPRTTHLIAIPTTAGTGSEATHFATIYQGKEKHSLAHPSLVPDYAIIDPCLTETLSPYITACTGMDALCQAMESLWSINSTDKSKKYAKEALKLAITNIESAVNNPTIKSRTAMAKASNLAGKAINISKTTACHAISYPITAHFNIPHGHAVALTLGKMLKYNGEVNEKDCVDPRGVLYIQPIIEEIINIFETSSLKETQQKIGIIMKNIGLNTNLNELGIPTTQIHKIIENVNVERAGNNPRKLTKEAITAMLSS